MATLKVLAQSNPTATVLTDFYTAPGGNGVVVSSIVVCNRSASASDTIRVSVAVGGAADGLAQYLYYDLPVLPSDTFAATMGITLAPGDVVRVRATAGTVSFSLFGEEQ